MIATRAPINRSLFDKMPKYPALVDVRLVMNFNIDDSAIKMVNAPKPYKIGCNFRGIFM